ncbi:MAG: GGDEF domain-containing protein [Krumholzibacteria bacterium]|nr:GGDEF domain-containing protein [Candidatus Krumholzibacteria bacterium]
MTPREAALRQLLSAELPLAQVGPHLRRAARRAVLSGDQTRMGLVARVIVTELLRRGDLVRVAAEGGADLAGKFCLLRETRRFLDISAVDGEPEGAPEAAPDPPVAAPAPAATTPALDLSDLIRVLEDAGRMDLHDPQAGEAGAVIDGILALMGRYLPQVRLFVVLHDAAGVPADARCVFAADPRETTQGWQAVRPPNGAVWITGPSELPGRIRARDHGGDDAEPGAAPFVFAAAAAVPLHEPAAGDDPTAEGREVGLLYLVLGEQWERDGAIRLARRVAGFVSRRWRNQRDVNRRIHNDGLTGVYNRRYFDNQFTHELERARRSGVPLTLVLADLDRFKAVNDSLGHATGDRVLKMVAQRLLDELRRIDHVCRIGGEEFALILPDTSPAAARDVMRRLLDAVFAVDAVVDGEPRQVRATFSYGVVTSPDAGTDAFELYRKADAMLYLSKDAGRNRCHFWSSDGEHGEMLPRNDASSS